jgi:hypothetical protein
LPVTVVTGGEHAASCDDADGVMAACRYGDDVAPSRYLLDARRSIARGEHTPVCGEGDGVQIARCNRTEVTPP